jgi:hypothetical protein
VLLLLLLLWVSRIIIIKEHKKCDILTKRPTELTILSPILSKMIGHIQPKSYRGFEILNNIIDDIFSRNILLAFPSEVIAHIPMELAMEYFRRNIPSDIKVYFWRNMQWNILLAVKVFERVFNGKWAIKSYFTVWIFHRQSCKKKHCRQNPNPWRAYFQ